MQWSHYSRVNLSATILDFPDVRKHLDGSTIYLTAQVEEETIRIKTVSEGAAQALPDDYVQLTGHVELDDYGRAVVVSDSGYIFRGDARIAMV